MCQRKIRTFLLYSEHCYNNDFIYSLNFNKMNDLLLGV